MSNPKQKTYYKFRTKVLTILLFIGIAPLLIVSLVSLATVIRTRLNNISELQSQALSAASEKIRGYLDQKMSVFNLVIDLNPDNIAEVDVGKLEFIAEGLKGATGDVREISFIDKYGKELVKESEVHGAESIPLKDVSQEESFKTARAGENYFGPVYYTLSGPIMHLASQIENKNREIIGVISAEISLEPIEKEVSQLKIGEEGFIYLVDRKGNLITSSNKDFARLGENLSYIPLVLDVLGGRVHDGLAKEDKYQNSLGQNVIFAGGPLGVPGWSVILEWPWRDAFSVVGVMLIYFVVIIVVSLILIIGFSLFFARLVVRPVESLSRGADELSKGNFDYKINVKTGDELEKLGERFNKMRKVLKENQRLRDEFVFIAAHELRAPVTVIRGYISMIMEGDAGPVSPGFQKLLSPVMKSGDGLNKLVEDLLEVARSQAGRIEIEVRPVSVVVEVKAVLQELKILSDEKAIKMVYKPQSGLPKILADSDKLKEVIKNLVDNAIKYTLGAGTITVSHEVKRKTLLTHIKDTGVGISKKHQKKLFQKFYRIKTRETEEVQGTGLGLWIIRHLLEKMNGKIWCNSQEGMGSTFSFSLPIVR